MRSIAKSNWAKLPFLLLTLSVTSGCVTDLTAPVPVSNYCSIAKPIGYDSTSDSAETVAAIEDHNSQWICICEADCPK